MRIALFISALCLIFTSSCDVEKRLARKLKRQENKKEKMRAQCNELFPPEVIVETVTEVDSVVTTDTITVIKDTTIYIQGDTVRITKTINCDEDGRVNLDPTSVTAGRVTATVAINDNVLQVDCHTDSLLLEIARYKQTIKELKRVQKNETTTITKREIRKERYIPGFYTFTFWWFWITAGLLLLMLILRRFLGKKLL